MGNKCLFEELLNPIIIKLEKTDRNFSIIILTKTRKGNAGMLRFEAEWFISYVT